MLQNGPGTVELENLGGSSYGGSRLVVNVNPDEWFEIKVPINLEANTHGIEVFQGGFLVGVLEDPSAPWSGGTGSTLEVQAVDLYSQGSSGFYYDDIVVEVPFPEFIRGDSDGNGIFNALADGLHLLNFGFLGGPPPPCLEAADADGDAVQSALVDALYILTHGFAGGPPPGAPYPSCGSDPDPANSLGCDVSTCP